ncbi:hypothetical protein CRUP_015816 [Coryphaenoides rupestris]|nr:hypothetical protein CRUP_015816 [Coryphaenoides rupestris]
MVFLRVSSGASLAGSGGTSARHYPLHRTSSSSSTGILAHVAKVLGSHHLLLPHPGVRGVAALPEELLLGRRRYRHRRAGAGGRRGHRVATVTQEAPPALGVRPLVVVHTGRSRVVVLVLVLVEDELLLTMRRLLELLMVEMMLGMLLGARTPEAVGQQGVLAALVAGGRQRAQAVHAVQVVARHHHLIVQDVRLPLPGPRVPVDLRLGNWELVWELLLPGNSRAVVVHLLQGRPKPLNRRLSSAFSCLLGPWLACLAMVLALMVVVGMMVVVLALMVLLVVVVVVVEVLERPESLLAERAWSLWSGLEVAEEEVVVVVVVVRAPRPSVAPAAAVPGVFLLLLMVGAARHIGPGHRDRLCIPLEPAQLLKGDIMIKCYHKSEVTSERQVVFRLQFHTGAVQGYSLTFDKEDMEAANKVNELNTWDPLWALCEHQLHSAVIRKSGICKVNT